MTEYTDVSVLSTMPHKLARDIHFATIVGRDAPFDPFVGRDITKLFSEKKQPSAHLMYFPNHPRRHHAPVVTIGRVTGRGAVVGTPAMPPCNDLMYDPPKSDPGKSVSFTRAARKALPSVPDAETPGMRAASEQLRRAATPGVSAPRGGGAGRDPSLFKLTSVSQEELMSCRERNAHRAAQRPASQMSQRPGVSFANSAGRSGRAPSSGAKLPAGGRASTIPKRHDTTTNTSDAANPSKKQRPVTPLRASAFKFPWEKEQEAAVRAKELQKRRFEKEHQRSVAKHAAETAAARALQGDDDGHTPSGLSPAPSSPASPRQGDDQQQQQQPHMSASATVEAEEAWLDKRREVLDRFGLLGAGNSRRSDAPRGADFRTTGRTAPVGFQPRGKETNDLMYAPERKVTSAARHVAHVELGKQAGRPDPKADPRKAYLRYVEGLLDYDKLAKLHRTTREREQRSFAGDVAPTTTTTKKGGTTSATPAPGGGSPGRDDGVFTRPLTAADEVAYHPETLRPPSRALNAVPHTTDAFLGADRADEPLAAVLGGDPRPYRRSAKRALGATGSS